MDPYYFDFGSNPLVLVYEGNTLWMVDLKKSTRAKIYSFSINHFNVNVFSKNLDKDLEMRDYAMNCHFCDNISIVYRGILVYYDLR